jgi:2-oxo-4-hydroxy-4-carboxy-5-ureidoimidazoline decarboxylase
MDTAPAQTRAALVEANRAYEERFGHVFLIRAAGRTAEEMLAALDERLRNDPQTERDVVRRELAQIVRLRLLRCVETGADR